MAREYGRKVAVVAARHEACSVVDTWELLQGADADAQAQFVSDGLHLNERGNEKVSEGLMKVVQTDFPKLAPMDDEDGEGRYGSSGLPVEEKLWKEIC